LVHCYGRITVETEGLQAETGNMLWLVKGANGKTLQEEEGVILRVIMQRACQMSSLVCRFASNRLHPSSTHLFGLLTPCWSLCFAGSGVQGSINWGGDGNSYWWKVSTNINPCNVDPCKHKCARGFSFLQDQWSPLTAGKSYKTWVNKQSSPCKGSVWAVMLSYSRRTW
jgi:hypothetical protein